MTDYSELISRLRVVDPPRRGSDRVMLSAACAIEAQAAELVRLRHADAIVRKLAVTVSESGDAALVESAWVALDAGELAYLRSLVPEPSSHDPEDCYYCRQGDENYRTDQCEENNG